MADQKISELTNITGANLANADEFVVVDISADQTKAITFGELKNAFDTSTGFVRVTGDTMTGNLSFGDLDKAIFGAGNDLQIYHDGNNSLIDEVGTGNLYLRSSNLYIQNIDSDPDEMMIAAVANGAVTLSHNGSAKIATSASGIDVTGSINAGDITSTGNLSSNKAAGYGSVEVGGPSGGLIDLKAPFSDDYDARVIYTAGADLQIITLAAGEPILLRQGNATKLATTATGVDVTGTVTADGLTVDGNVLVGKTSANFASAGVQLLPATASSFTQDGVQPLVLNRLTSDGDILKLFKDGVTVGSVSVTASATAYNTSSDYRLKENITPVQGAADIVKAMQPVTYTFKSDGSWHDGFLAHELQELHPRAVTGEKDAVKDEEYEVTPAVEATFDAEGVELTPAVFAVMGTRSVPDYQGVDYSKLTPILTAALQEALNKIDALEARLAAANI